MKYAVVAALDHLCGILDAIPSYSWAEKRWYRYGDWGCSLRLSKRSVDLDDRWHTGYWKVSP